MKKNYKKLIFPALTLAIFIPLVSMAASDTFSFPERGQKAIQYKQSSSENFNPSLVDRETRLAERDARRLANRAKHTEMMSVLESGDYNAWLEFAQNNDCPMISQVNEENFAEFVEAHKERVANRNSETKKFNRGGGSGNRLK